MLKVAMLDKSFNRKKIKAYDGQQIEIIQSADNNEIEYEHGNLCLNLFLELLECPVRMNCYAVGHDEQAYLRFIHILQEICEDYDIIFMSIGIRNALHINQFEKIVVRKRRNYIIASGDNNGKITYPASLKNILGVCCGQNSSNGECTVYHRINAVNGIEYVCEIPELMGKQLNSNSFAVPYFAALIANNKIRYVNCRENKKIDIIIKNLFETAIWRTSQVISLDYMIGIRAILLEQGYVGAIIMNDVENDCGNSVFDFGCFQKVKQAVEYVRYITEADYVIVNLCESVYLEDVDYMELRIDVSKERECDIAKKIIQFDI